MRTSDGSFRPLSTRPLDAAGVEPPVPAPRVCYWIHVADGPGYGVTASSRDQAIALAEDLAWRRKVPFELRSVTEDLDLATLSPEVRRWMDPPTSPGVWFPGSGKKPIQVPSATADDPSGPDSSEFERMLSKAYRWWIGVLVVSALVALGVRWIAGWPGATVAPLLVAFALLAQAITGRSFRRYLPVTLSKPMRIAVAIVAILVLVIVGLVAFPHPSP